MKIFTFLGCSYTAGVGLNQEKLDINNYANLVGTHFKAQTKNLAVPGSSNYDIFMSAMNEILFSKQEIIFVQWSHLNRQSVHPVPGLPGLRLHSKIKSDYKYNDLVFPKKILQTLVKYLYILNHDYYHITELANYVNILQTLSTNTKIVFINGAIPWTEDIAKLDTMTNYANNLSTYSKELFDFEHNDDIRINQLFLDLNQQLQRINANLWVNMFSSFVENKLDLANDNLHPGPKSHNKLADSIITHITR